MTNITSMVLFVCGISLVLLIRGGTNYIGICVKPENWIQNPMAGGFALIGKVHLHLDGASFLVCLKECMLRSRCKSINWRPGSCDLNYQAATHSMNLTIFLSDTYTDIRLWPTSLAEGCANHTCNNRSVCVPLRNGYTCKIEGCILSRQLAVWNLNVISTFYPIGTEVNIGCPSGYYASAPRTCLSSGVWTDFECIQMLTSCSNLTACNPQYATGGDFWLYSRKAGTAVKIRCKQTSTNTDLKSYLVFPRPNIFQSTANRSLETCHLDSYLGVVNYNGLAIDVETLKVHTREYRMFDYTDSPVAYGSVYDCSDISFCGQSPSVLILNTTGTGLIIDINSDNWSRMSMITSLNVTSSNNGRIVKVICSGGCGLCYPTNYTLSLHIDSDYRPDETSAIFPQCTSTSDN